MSAPRWMHHVYASLAGYFWLPCPLCGRFFGGHESGGCLYFRGNATSRTGRIVCSRHPGEYVIDTAPPEMLRTSLDVVVPFEDIHL